jgi:hypothetical protein
MSENGYRGRQAMSDQEVEAQKAAIWELVVRIEAAVEELGAIAREMQEGSDGSWQGDPSLLRQSAEALWLPRFCLEVEARPRPNPEWIVLVRVGGSSDAPEHVRLRQVWDEELNRPVFAERPPEMEMILRVIERQIDEHVRNRQAEFPWLRYPAEAEEILPGLRLMV